MSHAAMARMKRFSLDQTFEAFWNDHLAIVEPATSDDPQAHPPVAKVNVPL
jgi:hypothetical protein